MLISVDRLPHMVYELDVESMLGFCNLSGVCEVLLVRVAALLHCDTSKE